MESSAKMTTETNEMPDAFEVWADDYIRRQYPFYNAEACGSVGAPLKRQLRNAWDAGRADTLKPTTLNGGDAAKALADLDAGVTGAASCFAWICRHEKTIRTALVQAQDSGNTPGKICNEICERAFVEKDLRKVYDLVKFYADAEKHDLYTAPHCNDEADYEKIPRDGGQKAREAVAILDRIMRE